MFSALTSIHLFAQRPLSCAAQALRTLGQTRQASCSQESLEQSVATCGLDSRTPGRWWPLAFPQVRRFTAVSHAYPMTFSVLIALLFQLQHLDKLTVCFWKAKQKHTSRFLSGFHPSHQLGFNSDPLTDRLFSFTPPSVLTGDLWAGGSLGLRIRRLGVNHK